jgi:hypothetical protein
VAFRQWIGKATAQLMRLQRATDLLSIDGLGKFLVLLPETDALGAAMFKRRAFDEFRTGEVLAILGPGSRAKFHVAAASYPSDGTQLESLLRLLDERIENDGSSLVRDWVFDDKPIAECLESLLDGAMEERCETVAEIAEFVLAEPIRRSETRSLLFAAPGEMLRKAVTSGLGALLDRSAEIEILVLGEPPKRDAEDSENSVVQWVSRRELGEVPLFLIYFGEGSAYAMICEEAQERDRTRFFQTCDRNLVEHLALRAQHELHGSGSDRA